jgi:oxygen-independent coproporphyrinogen-3 oxidase
MNTKKLYSLYIHWPFCSSKCHYCDFVAFEQHQDHQDAYHAALIQEIEHFVQTSSWYEPDIKTIFIGGGTPSLYPLDKMEELFATLKKHFNLSGVEELCMEANPADITEERLDAWESFGINRLSVGVQVLDDDVLFKLNRRQRTRDVINALNIIPKYFDNFSMDFILGLPNVTTQTWEKSIDTVLDSPAKHVSVYFLTVHEKTPLYYKISKGLIKLPDEDYFITTYEKTVQKLASNGFEQYEISNFAKPGFASIHNQAYWNRLPYKGFGIGACSFDGTNRYQNEKNLTTYLTSILTKKDFKSIVKSETVDPEQEIIESFMLNLRQIKGMDLHRMVYLLGSDKQEQVLYNLNELEQHNLITQDNGKIRLTLKGMALENEVIVRLIQ